MGIDISNRINNSETLLINIAIKPLYIAPKVIYGVAMGALSLLSLGLSEKINNNLLYSTTLPHYITSLHSSLLKVINPNAKNKVVMKEESQKGFLLHHLALPVIKKTQVLISDKDSFFRKQISLRLSYTVAALATAVSQIADLAIGIFSAALSIVTFGRIEKVNNFSTDQLFTGASTPFFLIYFLRLAINPKAHFRTEEKNVS